MGNKNAARASHPSRICFVGSRSAFVTARRRNDRFGPTALASRRVASATFAEAGCRSARSCESRIRNRCGGQRSCPAREEQEGRRPLCPGNQPRLRACPDVPRQFTLENHRLPLARRNHSASSGMPTFSLRTTLLHRTVGDNWKTPAPCAQTVDVATSLWNLVENLE
jgi:hypothetical protein